ncbi:hypothetical protein SLS59_008275 [Nothophoma quercina]|uniref:Uncharacterized protein n=1 Tax=Nothophoma quercina TaxID=749835 RepID=A0ABR3QU12_9PLEO
MAAIDKFSLPADLAITERSRKFYDGTYTWDANGFTDEHGVHRVYDCYDPEARAPTPLPPMVLEDEEELENDRQHIDTSIETKNVDSVSTAKGAANVEATSPYPKSSDVAASAPIPRTPQEFRRLALAFTANLQPSRAVRQNTPPIELEDKEGDTNASKFENAVAVSEQAVTESTPSKNHEQTQVPSPAKAELSTVKMPDTPPDSPMKARFDVQITSPSSTVSTLSPVPSNLSDHDIGLKIKGTSTTAPSTPSLPKTPSKISSRTRGKPTTTRGVARKVTKGSKKTPGSKSSPPKRKENSVEDFTLQELHPEAFMRKGGLKRSVRQARPERK